jgi:hypothetical protein
VQSAREPGESGDQAEVVEDRRPQQPGELARIVQGASLAPPPLASRLSSSSWFFSAVSS